MLTALQAEKAALVEPPEASAITAPLKLNHIDVELKVAMRVTSTGHLNLTVLRGQTEAAQEQVHTVRLSLGPDIPFDMGG